MVIFIPLQGGFGNQLLQITAGLYLEETLNKEIIFDKTFFNQLFKFKNPRKLEVDFLLNQNQTVDFSLKNLIYRVSKSSKVLEEKDLNDLIIKRLTKNTKLLVGYFHNIEYVDIAWLKINQPLIKKLNENSSNSLINKNDIVIHFRGGDYLINKKTRAFHGLTSLEYYKNALRQISNDFEINKVHIVTDTPNFVINFFDELKLNLNIVSNGNLFTDLEFISNAKNVIMSNSSFSWWGAYLAEKKNNAKVIYPEPWTSQSQQNPLYFFRPNWIKLTRSFN